MGDDDDLNVHSLLAAAQETVMYQRHLIRRSDVAFWWLLVVNVVLGLSLIVCVTGK